MKSYLRSPSFVCLGKEEATEVAIAVSGTGGRRRGGRHEMHDVNPPRRWILFSGADVEAECSEAQGAMRRRRRRR